MDYKFGTMIEIPRAALTADEIADYAQFFSFGTNDLTQTTFGISRDDAETGFLVPYISAGILPENPFATIDRGRGRADAHGRGAGPRQVKPGLMCGICGEHGGDPELHRLLPQARAWTTCPARRSGCRSPAWPRRTRPPRAPEVGKAWRDPALPARVC